MPQQWPPTEAAINHSTVLTRDAHHVAILLDEFRQVLTHFWLSRVFCLPLACFLFLFFDPPRSQLLSINYMFFTALQVYIFLLWSRPT